jgi:hypothetical protein
MDNRSGSYTVHGTPAPVGAEKSAEPQRVRAIIAPRGQSTLGSGAAALPLKSAPQVANPPAAAPEAPK